MLIFDEKFLLRIETKTEIPNEKAEVDPPKIFVRLLVKKNRMKIN